jgi:hypothetical protein
MLDILREFLDANTTAEEKNHIALADRVLVRAEMDNYEQVIEEIIMTAEEQDSGLPLANILAVYRQQLFQLLTLHSITVVPELGLNELANIVTGLLDIDNYENPQSLFELADEEAPTLEKFCVMMSQVTRYTADELLVMIEDVADGFLLRLKEINQTEQHEDENMLTDRRERMHAYRKFETFMLSISLTITQMPAILRSGVNPSLPFLMYAMLIDTNEALQGMKPKQAAAELFAAALVSSDGYGNPNETVKANLEQFIAEPKAISAIMVEVRQLMMGYQA